MKRETLILAGIDYDAALRRFVGREDLYEKYLIQFLEDTNFGRLESAMQQKNCKEAFKAAHALKGVVATLGINRLFAVIDKVVEALRAGDLSTAEKYMPDVQNEYKYTIRTIKGNFA